MQPDKQLAENAIKFLVRAQLTGAEAPAFMEVVAWLKLKLDSPSQDNKLVGDDLHK